VAKNTHDVVTSLDTWSRRRIYQSMLAVIDDRQWPFSPQNTLNATDDPHAGVPALP
jgi:hypothetical protein